MAALHLFVLAVMATTVLATDKLLTSAGASCNDKFKQIMADNYAGDSSCQDTIKAAMTTAPTDVSQCPGGVLANVGTPVQKCMAKSQQTRDAWISLIKQCEVMNVNERNGAGEAEAAADAKPSCFPRFDSLQSFVNYMGSISSSEAAVNTVTKGAAAVAAAVGFALLF